MIGKGVDTGYWTVNNMTDKKTEEEKLKKLMEEHPPYRLTPDVVMEDHVTISMLPHDLESAVYRVLQKIPDEVLEYVHETCDFIDIPDSGGKYIDTKKYRQNLIVLAENIKEEDMEVIIAHEIAHSFLRHGGRMVSVKEDKRREEEADNLIVKWGYNRVNESYDFDK
jgi:hypothetical protein